MAALADVLLRGLASLGQAVAIAGVLCAWLVVERPRASVGGRPSARPFGRLWSVVALGAAGVAVAQCLSLAVLVGALEGSHGLVRELSTTLYVQVSIVRFLASVALVGGALAVRRRARVGLWWVVLVAAAIALVGSAAWSSHAAGRLTDRGTLVVLDALHQLGAAAWIGGLVHLLVAARSGGKAGWSVALLRRFSALALAAVATLIAAGVGLTLAYVGSVPALLGTAYGVMVLTKAVLLGGLLVLGATNFFLVRRLPDGATVSPLRLRRFVEVEIGVGVAVLFAAASLTSLPPAIDVVADRATLGEVAMRFAPQWPTLTSPSLDQLPIDDPNAPRTDADRAWSEYNHHVSGLFVLLMGALALLHVAGVGWARHWPLVLLGLAGFMLVRNDPGAWPLGPQGFWAGMVDPTVVQHRAFVLLVVAFAFFEWMVRTGRLPSTPYALVFPLLCAVGGALLLTHSHGSQNLKAEFLLEVTHTPLGVLGMLIGWARWLEVRVAAPEARVPARVWSSALLVFGILLLLYRES